MVELSDETEGEENDEVLDIEDDEDELDVDVENPENIVLEPIESLESLEIEDEDELELKKPPEKIVRKAAVKTPPVKTELLDAFGPVRKAFILDNIRMIDYVDLAKLAGIKADDLKKAVEEIGVKLPIERARKWADLDVGTFKSIADCSRCQVQLNHSAFYVDINKCRPCLEKNITYWIEKGIKIRLMFGR